MSDLLGKNLLVITTLKTTLQEILSPFIPSFISSMLEMVKKCCILVVYHF